MTEPARLYFKTERLICRPLASTDRDELIDVHSDPRMSKFFPFAFTPSYIDGLIERIEAAQTDNGFCFGPTFLRSTGRMVGLVGLNQVSFEAPFTPAVEVGWRIAANHWGRGYASEAGAGALRFGFEQLQLTEIVSFAVPANIYSTRVMQRIGMKPRPDLDFDHPDIEAGSALKRHVLYSVTLEEWQRANPD